MRQVVDEDQIGVLFSGGLDSTIVAILASELSEVTLYTVVVENSYDLDAGRTASELLRIPWKPLVIRREDVLDAVREMVVLTSNRNPVNLSFEIPLFVVSKYAKEHLLLSGQGADELFAGYARYMSMTAEEKKKQMDLDLAKLMDLVIEHERVIAEYHGRVIRYPFLQPPVLEAVNSIPVEERTGYGCTKELLRDVARLVGAGELADRKKKAAQYGSGVMRVLKAEAKKRGTSVRGLVAEIARDAL